MVVIRLARGGAKKRPFYQIVATDSRNRRDGRFIEEVGYYNPLTNPDEVKLEEDKIFEWLEKGAQPSDTVRSLLSKAGLMTRYHDAKYGK